MKMSVEQEGNDMTALTNLAIVLAPIWIMGIALLVDWLLK
jgi:hypothetical protein